MANKTPDPNCTTCYGRGYMWAISMGGGPGVPGRTCPCNPEGRMRNRDLDQTRECECVAKQVAEATANVGSGAKKQRPVKAADPDCRKCAGVGLW